jgi:hypothetical protein
MTPNEKGRHCASCNKTVIDFSNWTDKDLARFFSKSTGNVCGHFSYYQLERTINISENKKRPFISKLAWAAAIASWFGFSPKGEAQTHKKHHRTELKITPLQTISPLDKTNATGTGPFIEGSITDIANGGPMVFATIYAKERPLMIETSGVNGQFKLYLSDMAQDSKVTLVIESKGYQTKEIEITLDSLVQKPLQVKLSDVTQYIVDGMVVRKEVSCVGGAVCVSVIEEDIPSNLPINNPLEQYNPAVGDNILEKLPPHSTLVPKDPR